MTSQCCFFPSETGSKDTEVTSVDLLDNSDEAADDVDEVPDDTPNTEKVIAKASNVRVNNIDQKNSENLSNDFTSNVCVRGRTRTAFSWRQIQRGRGTSWATWTQGKNRTASCLIGKRSLLTCMTS